MAKKGPKKGTGGRPKVEPRELTFWESVGQLLMMQSTGTEVAAYHGISYSTLKRRCEEENGVTFGQFSAEKKEGGKASLRKLQWRHAQIAPAMAIFLGKNILDQSDKRETKTEHTGSVSPLVMSSNSRDPDEKDQTAEVAAMAKELQELKEKLVE